MTSATIKLDNVTKTFDGRVLAVDGVTLDIAAGEFFSLLGPSGCGKTTSLRMIAGFELPDSGRVHVAGRDITDLPVHKRDMGMVFQSYALFPHRTVAENVAFGLRMREVAKPEIERRVKAALSQVALTGLEERKPGQLSGGQQQRVALARALVVEPPVLLCDEPLGALDRKLRQQMQFELKELQKRLGVTLVFVTHDQEEALAMSDRIAVMNHGKVEQVGAPTEIYERPRTRFVADFIGEINILEDTDRARALRPEKIRLVSDGARVSGTVETANFLGGSTLLRVRTADSRSLLVRETHAGERASRAPGDAVGLAWNDSDAVVLER
ncbi:MAG TPA: ABC transporter ATP-binding protein [Reyranella sp.]|jgi:ABC-type Fe3+/spermidine/putrescine transport system ATPase subunit|nr:ABC transporter ATP-binding protein [Reyranella sp.]